MSRFLKLLLVIMAVTALLVAGFGTNFATADDEVAQDATQSSVPAEETTEDLAAEEVAEEAVAEEAEVVEEAPVVAPASTPATQEAPQPAEPKKSEKSDLEKGLDKDKGYKSPAPGSSPAPDASGEPTWNPAEPLHLYIECVGSSVEFYQETSLTALITLTADGRKIDEFSLTPSSRSKVLDLSQYAKVQYRVDWVQGQKSVGENEGDVVVCGDVEEPIPTTKPTPTLPEQPDPSEFEDSLLQECVTGGALGDRWGVKFSQSTDVTAAVELLNEAGEVTEVFTLKKGDAAVIDVIQHGAVSFTAVWGEWEDPVMTDGDIIPCGGTGDPDPDPSEEPTPTLPEKPDVKSGETVTSSLVCLPEGGGTVTRVVTPWTQDWVMGDDGEWVLDEKVSGEPVETSRPATDAECPAPVPTPTPTDPVTPKPTEPAKPSPEPTESVDPKPTETVKPEPSQKPGLPGGDDKSKDRDDSGSKDKSKKKPADTKKKDTGNLPATGFAGDGPNQPGAGSLIGVSLLTAAALMAAASLRKKVKVN